MRFQHYPLGHLHRGQVVEVTLQGNAANVCLMDSANFSSYKARRAFHYLGGHVTRSPVRLTVPHTGTWHVAIDFGGHSGNIRSSVQVLPGALPPFEEAALSSLPSLVRPDNSPPPATEGAQKHFDVFISHASEDKNAIVRNLAEALQGKGLSVWYDEFELRIGDSLRRTIDRGIASSRFGIIVLSKAFFGKGWPNYELDGLVTRSVGGEQVLLPIWHGVTKQEVIDFSPSLADKLARSTATHTVEEIAVEIAELIQSGRS